MLRYLRDTSLFLEMYTTISKLFSRSPHFESEIARHRIKHTQMLQSGEQPCIRKYILYLFAAINSIGIK